jgi:hypothetical protein
MKKFFIAFLILAVTAANVFAQVTYSGELFGRWNVLAGESGKTRSGAGVEEVYSGWLTSTLGLSTPYIRSRFHITAVNEDKTWGGWIRIQPSSLGGSAQAQARVWWQPIPQVKATLGQYGFRPFSAFGAYNGRGDYLEAGAAAAEVIPEYNTGDYSGFALELAPIANLKIAVVVPGGPTSVTKPVKTPGGSNTYPVLDEDGDPVDGNFITLPYAETTKDVSYPQPAEVLFRRTGIWAGYTLEGIGTIGVGFKGSSKDYTTGDDYKDTNLADARSQINVGFDLTAIPNLKLQIGAAYFIPQDTDGKGPVKSEQTPISINLGAQYELPDTFGVRAMVDVDVAGKTEYEGNTPATEKGLFIAFTLDPWANVGIGKAGLAVDLKVTGPGKLQGVDDHGDKLDLVITPYFQKAYGGGTFTAGFKLGFANFFDDQPTQDDESGKITWAIPVGLSYSF